MGDYAKSCKKLSVSLCLKNERRRSACARLPRYASSAEDSPKRVSGPVKPQPRLSERKESENEGEGGEQRETEIA